jgi:hypothetical protein
MKKQKCLDKSEIYGKTELGKLEIYEKNRNVWGNHKYMDMDPSPVTHLFQLCMGELYMRIYVHVHINSFTRIMLGPHKKRPTSCRRTSRRWTSCRRTSFSPRGHIKRRPTTDFQRFSVRRLALESLLCGHLLEKTFNGKTSNVLPSNGKTSDVFYVATKKTATGQLKVSMFKLFHNYILI